MITIIMPQANTEKYSPITHSIATKLPKQDNNLFIDDGLFLNSTDFVRKAIREKLKNREDKTLKKLK